MDKEEAISKATSYVNRAKQLLEYDKAILFGSYIYGKPREDSDLDIAFIVKKIKKNNDYLELLSRLTKLASEVDSRIEPHVMEEKDKTGFKDYIFKKGYIISN
jgi:predicted nucleotidyltransferase